MNINILLPEIILTITMIIILLIDHIAMKGRTTRVTGVIGLLLAGGSLFFLTDNLNQTWGKSFIFDAYSLFFKALLIIVACTIILISFKYVKKKGIRAGEFYSLIISATLGMLIMVSSYSLITIYVGLELMSISAYVLTGMLQDNKESIEASLKYFLIGALTSTVLLFGISLVYGVTGTIDITQIAQVIETGQGALTMAAINPLLMMGIVFIITGFGFKVAAVPFHMWAPDTYQGAPTSITAFLIAGSEAAAFAALLRILNVGFIKLAGNWSLPVAILALLSMTLGNIGALTQTNIKRMMAYSAIAQAGYILVGVAVATQNGTFSVLYYLLVYAFMTLGSFAVIIMLSNNLNSDEISSFKGLSEKSPFFAGAMTIFFLSLIGIPPTGGFLGKFYIFRAAVGSNYLWLALIMAINSVISLPYYYGVVKNMYLESPINKVKLNIPLELKVVVGVSIVAILGLGIIPETFINMVELVVK
ncbi:NADH-quinone oxidoreductase subunit N [Selenihalanaerobacter shriftii]|uniref:NADH-quinone oxidoreductase subunit N n=1 Tax=Selenihalanaerobacter shriftii TaxID=142842 RepID=A0A1T4LUF6_9FIRM|nr:NADH-quinone oxidoreductase subunit N [Selenihalanaerobacter shriftii]SJZ58287.1 NADH dehydrogenase subunit N [Selenihalanaerobacter shriftii]